MLDHADLRLLHALQADAQMTTHQLADLLHLSASQAGRRRQRLEAEGYITGYHARLNTTKMGLDVQAFLQIQTTAHTPDTHNAFLRLSDLQPEIIAAWSMTGEADYMLRVFCADLEALNRLVQDVLLPHPSVARVHSQIVLEQFKADGPLPT
ncbi:MAG: Lrp/AsnC family transcriptional regulator [Paracoccaceae bacterium]